MEKWTEQEIEETYQAVLNKATDDEIFRKKLKSSPVAAIEEVAGKSVGEGFDIKVIENDPNYQSLTSASGALSEEELENVAGGFIDGNCGAKFTGIQIR